MREEKREVSPTEASRGSRHTHTDTVSHTLKELGEERCKKCDALPVTDMATSPSAEKGVPCAAWADQMREERGRNTKLAPSSFLSVV